VVKDINQPFFGLNFAGTRAAHLELGGFNTEYGLKGTGGGVGEDVDLFERAFRAGMKIAYTPKARVRHMIEPERVYKTYHRRRMWIALPKYYGHMHILFSDTAWLAGLPRFFYINAVKDLMEFGAAAVTFDKSRRFYHELRLLRFAGLVREAARHGFGAGSAPAGAGQQS
jgi:GT2 family glycosyltransferase